MYFDVLGPWDRPTRMPEVREARGPFVARAAFVFMVLSVLGAGVVFARRNLRMGRGDRRGALRVAAFVFTLSLLAWLVGAHHVGDLIGQFFLLFAALGLALLRGAFVWVAYLALEPYVRRRWPDLLISWTRLLSGRFRDPLVGRDVLIGMIFGGVIAIVFQIDNGLPSFWNVPGMTPIPQHPSSLAGPGPFAGWIFTTAVISTLQALAVTGLVMLSWVILRRLWLAVGVAAVVLALMQISGENVLVEAPMALAVGALLVFVAARFGLVALVVSCLTRFLLMHAPLTLDFSRWYAARSAFVLALVASLAVYGFHTSLGGRPAFRPAPDD